MIPVELLGIRMKRSNLIIIAVAVVAIVVLAGIRVSGVLSPSESKTITYLDVPPVNQQAFIEQGRIDGGVSWEPYVSDSIAAGTAKAVIWSGDIWPNHPCWVLVADTSFAKSNPETVARVLKANVEANLWIADTIANKDTNPGNYTLLLNIGAEFSNRNTTVVDMSLQHMKLTYNITPETVSYLKMFVNEYVNASIIQSGKVSNVESFVNNLVDTSYINMTADIQPVAPGTPLTPVNIGYLQGDLHQFARVVAENTTVGEGRSLFATYGIKTNVPAEMPVAGYPNGGAVMTAFAARDSNIEMGYLGAPPVLLQHANLGIDVKILALANTEGSALVVNVHKPVKDLNTDLSGLTIGEPGPSSIQYLLLVTIAEKYGYKLTT